VETLLPKDQKVALMAMRMIHVARDKTSAFGEAESRDEILESIPILLNILESVQHLLMSHTAGGVVNLQNMYSRFCRGPPEVKPDDGSTAVDAEFKNRLKVKYNDLDWLINVFLYFRITVKNSGTPMPPSGPPRLVHRSVRTRLHHPRPTSDRRPMDFTPIGARPRLARVRARAARARAKAARAVAKASTRTLRRTGDM
jgi:hypothetical protein